MLIKAAILGFVIVAASALPSLAIDIWYEDNNLGRGGGMPADFAEKFLQPESVSQARRFQGECELMRQRWGHLLSCDPYYSPHLTLQNENYSLAMQGEQNQVMH